MSKFKYKLGDRVVVDNYPEIAYEINPVGQSGVVAALPPFGIDDYYEIRLDNPVDDQDFLLLLESELRYER